MTDYPWLLPEGVEELLPPEAESVEALRRKVLDLYSTWGYELVQPPLMEYLDSLLTGTGKDLDLQTFKLIDQLNGRMMGVRADMTPQVSRIEAHRLKQLAPTRLCYCGPVLHTRADAFGGSRSPMQLGAELYGHYGVESDVEVIQLMLETLRIAELPELYLDLGHVGIFHGLAKQLELTTQQQTDLFEMLQRKSAAEIAVYLRGLKLPDSQAEMLQALTDLNGNAEVLDRARQVLAGAADEVFIALDYLQSVGQGLQGTQQQVSVHYDLAEFRAYHYQTGMVFAAYLEGQGQEIARGGRYDDIGKVFGRARPATGFSTDLNALAAYYLKSQASANAIYAPADLDPNLAAMITELRARGEKVVRALPGQEGAARDMRCNRVLVQRDGAWQTLDL